MKKRRPHAGVLLWTLSWMLIAVVSAVVPFFGRVDVQRTLSPQGRSVVRSWEYVEGFPEEIAVFQTVFWEPRDTSSLRELIETTDLVRGKTALEIGTGSGLVSLCCLRNGAARVIATDVNSNAIENAKYNAHRLGLADRLDVRLVTPDAASAFSALAPNEAFDVIISNPPWEDAQPRTMAERALYDRDFQLLRSIVSEAKGRLNPGGRILLAYGCRNAILLIERLAAQHDWSVARLDDRSIEMLPEVFIPGMLLELLPQ